MFEERRAFVHVLDPLGEVFQRPCLGGFADLVHPRLDRVVAGFPGGIDFVLDG